MQHGHHQRPLPHLHWHSPHVDWHELEHPLRALLAALLVVIAATATAWAATSYLPQISITATGAMPAAVADTGRELPREWRWEREPVRFDHMVRPGAEGAPSLAGMVRERP